jgi:hypothetical protein
MSEIIKQLLPATGYYAVVASQTDLGQINLDKIPLIGWAIVHHQLGSSEASDRIEGVCLLADTPLICGDSYEFQTCLQEVRGQVYVGYCSEGQLETQGEYFRQQADHMLQVMERRISGVGMKELEEKTILANLDNKGISH